MNKRTAHPLRALSNATSTPSRPRQLMGAALLLMVWLLALSSLSGCVRQSTYDELQAQLDATRTQLEDELTQAQRERDACRGELAQTQSDLERQQTDRAALEKRLAELVKDKAQLDSSVEEMQEAIAELARRKAEADKRIEEFRQLLGRFQKLIDAGKLEVKIVDGRMIVQLATDVLFKSGSAKLSKEGREAISEVTQILASIPGRNFQIEGHTDNVPIRSKQYPSNWELAAARAQSVLQTMLKAGMPASRVSAASYGEHRPVASNDSKEERAANRRIEIVIVPDLSLLPGFKELEDLAADND